MSVTVFICTYNRGNLIHETLRSLIEGQELKPDESHTWLILDNTDEYRSFLRIAKRSTPAESEIGAIFDVVSPGVKSNRDEVVYDFDRNSLVARVQDFIEAYNGCAATP